MKREHEGVEVLISEEDIKRRVHELADQISSDYKQKRLLLVGVLRGSVIFLADLIRELDLDDVEVDTIGIESYGENTESSRNPRITQDLKTDIRGRDVLLIEDIVDTGYSLDALTRLLSARGVASLKTCALLSKLERREVDVAIDYLGFEIPNVWVEGYGMDTDQRGRGLPFVGVRRQG